MMACNIKAISKGVRSWGFYCLIEEEVRVVSIIISVRKKPLYIIHMIPNKTARFIERVIRNKEFERCYELSCYVLSTMYLFLRN